jgi:hypothetical protein
MTMREGTTGRFAETFLVAACLLAFACAADPPRPVALGETIAIGPYAFKVVTARPLPNPPPPISTFRAQPGRKGVAVFVRWHKLDDAMDAMRRIAFVENFLTDHLSIVDGSGERTKRGRAMQENLMYMRDPGSNWQDWVVVFHVPDASRDLSLVVENPEPRDGQSQSTTMKLNM